MNPPQSTLDIMILVSYLKKWRVGSLQSTSWCYLQGLWVCKGIGGIDLHKHVILLWYLKNMGRICREKHLGRHHRWGLANGERCWRLKKWIGISIESCFLRMDVWLGGILGNVLEVVAAVIRETLCCSPRSLYLFFRKCAILSKRTIRSEHRDKQVGCQRRWVT